MNAKTPRAESGRGVFARRKGRDWYLAGINAAGARTVTITPSFLGGGRFSAAIARDDLANPAAVTVDTATMTSTSALTFELRAGGGFVVRLVPSGS